MRTWRSGHVLIALRCRARLRTCIRMVKRTVQLGAVHAGRPRDVPALRLKQKAASGEAGSWQACSCPWPSSALPASKDVLPCRSANSLAPANPDSILPGPNPAPTIITVNGATCRRGMYYNGLRFPANGGPFWRETSVAREESERAPRAHGRGPGVVVQRPARCREAP